jgi:hypothetical protein
MTVCACITTGGLTALFPCSLEFPKNPQKNPYIILYLAYIRYEIQGFPDFGLRWLAPAGPSRREGRHDGGP